MDDYLIILKEKANKIKVNIEICGNDKDCIKEILASTVKSNLEKDDLAVLKDKADKIDANIDDCEDNKSCILDAIENRVKVVLEEQNQQISSIKLEENFKPLYFPPNVDDVGDIGDIGE